MQKNTHSIEQNAMMSNVNRASKVIDEQLVALNSIANDYGQWDDTYAYMENRDPEYLKSNYIEETFSHLKINILILVDTKGEIVFERYFDLATHQFTKPYKSVILPDQPMQGILSREGELILLVSSPIQMSDETGSPRGWLIMGRLLNEAQIQLLSDQLELNIHLHGFPQEANHLSPYKADQFFQDPNSNTQNIGIRAIDEEYLLGFTLLRDIHQQPSILLEVFSPRPINAQLQNGLRYLAWALFGIGSVFAAILLIFVERVILRRLVILNQGIDQIRNQGDLSIRFDLKGSDELRVLGEALNETLTQLQDTQRKLQDSQHQAEAANQAKSEFLAIMSHEIRTPMNAVLGVADLMDMTNLDQEQQDYLQIVRSSGSTLLTILNDILDFSKIEAGRLEIVKQPMNLSQCMMKLVTLFQGLATEKGLLFSTQINSSLPDWIQADETRLTQILSNLLSNAVKFTDMGRIELEVKWVDQGSRQILLRFSVRDSGIGISPEQLKRLFNPFVQAEATTTFRYGGTGLGLVISSRLCQLMQGKLYVESQPGQGSCFWFEIPVQCVDSPVKARKSLKPTQKPLRILLAEDNLVNQKVAKHMLQKLGYEPEIANNGIEVLQKLETSFYDVIFMDLHMPEMDGLTAAKMILTGSKQPYLIAMTASAFQEDRERCEQVGMHDFLTKPVRIDDLANSLHRAQQKIVPHRHLTLLSDCSPPDPKPLTEDPNCVLEVLA